MRDNNKNPNKMKDVFEFLEESTLISEYYYEDEVEFDEDEIFERITIIYEFNDIDDYQSKGNEIEEQIENLFPEWEFYYREMSGGKGEIGFIK